MVAEKEAKGPRTHSMDGFECHDKNLELDFVFNGEPLHRERSTHMICSVTCVVKQGGCYVLDDLQFFRMCKLEFLQTNLVIA